MNRDEETIIAEAAGWHAASEDDAFDWDAFVAWLEADPRNAQAYDQVALADAVLQEHTAALSKADGDDASNGVELARRRRFGWAPWAGGAVAAALVAAVAIPRFAEPAPQVFDTGARSRVVALGDGSSVVLAPRSRLEIAGRKQDRLTLAGGGWFDIRHDPARSLAITVGDETIRDVGTRFDVQNTAGDLRVAVAEGAVSIESDAFDAPVRLNAGRALSLDRAAKVAQTAAFDPSAAGRWRQGRQTYQQAPLTLVAADLARYAGVRVDVDDAVADRRFSGTLITSHGDGAARDLSQLMGLALDARNGSYRLRPTGG